MTITATISTKNRYFSTLPMAIISIAHQTHKPDKLIIFDDGDQLDLREDELYKDMFNLLNLEGIEWQVIFGEKKGQVANHQKAIDICHTDYIWRLDDDNYAEPNVLEILLGNFNEKVGAVGGLVIDPSNTGKLPDGLRDNKIEDIYNGLNIQWYKFEGPARTVDHLYSSFLFRTDIASYCMELSPAGHREETMMSHEMKRKGFELLVDPKAITWHFRSPTGGIRSYQQQEFWDHDEMIFRKKIEEWGIKLN